MDGMVKLEHVTQDMRQHLLNKKLDEILNFIESDKDLLHRFYSFIQPIMDEIVDIFHIKCQKDIDIKADEIAVLLKKRVASFSGDACSNEICGLLTINILNIQINKTIH